VTVLLLAGCTAAPAENPPSASSATPSPSAPVATPSSSPSTAPEPSPTATLPTREADATAVRKSLVAAADLGRPWVQSEDPPDRDEACPGTRSAVGRLTFRSTARRNLTRGADELVNGATFQLATLPDVNATKVRAAWATDTHACRQYTDQDDYYVVYRLAGPTDVPGADEILLGRIERVYFDRGDDEPAYARQTLVARRGRVVATVTYSFLTTEADPEATDFSETTELLQTQLAKAAKAFAE
jgi:hypothetical protein